MRRYLWGIIVAVAGQITLNFWISLYPPARDLEHTARSLLLFTGLAAASVTLFVMARAVRQGAANLRAARGSAAVVMGLSALTALAFLAAPVLHLVQHPLEDPVTLIGQAMIKLLWLATVVTGLLTLGARPRPVIPASVLLLTLLTGFTLDVTLPYVRTGPASEPDTSYLVRAEGGEVHRGRIYGLTVWSGAATVGDYLLSLVDPKLVLVPETESQGVPSTAALNQMLVDSEAMAKAVGLQLVGRGKGATAAGTGARVTAVVPGLPAAAALQPGDLIVGLNGAPVTSWTQLRSMLLEIPPGGQVSLAVKRNGESLTATLTTVPAPDNPARGQVGLLGSDEVLYDIPVPIATSIPPDVGGPSMGLALTLQVVDQFTPGGITGGRVIAATGEILPGGQVGPVGGLRHKAKGAERTGASVLFVPSENYQEATSSGAQIQVVPVESVQEVLAWLKAHPK